MKKGIIAEKPSMTRKITSIIGNKKNDGGYIEDNNYLVTWISGHRIQLVMRKQYEAVGFNRANLPVLL